MVEINLNGTQDEVERFMRYLGKNIGDFETVYTGCFYSDQENLVDVTRWYAGPDDCEQAIDDDSY